MTTGTILSVQALSIQFDDRSVIHNLSFAVDAGDNVAIIGTNGAGKTVVKIGHDEHWGSFCQVDVDDLKVTIKYIKRQDNGDYSVDETFSYTVHGGQ